MNWDWVNTSDVIAAIAALIASISLAVAIWAVTYARRQAIAAENSAQSSARAAGAAEESVKHGSISAAAAVRSADAAEESVEQSKISAAASEESAKHASIASAAAVRSAAAAEATNDREQRAEDATRVVLCFEQVDKTTEVWWLDNAGTDTAYGVTIDPDKKVNVHLPLRRQLGAVRGLGRDRVKVKLTDEDGVDDIEITWHHRADLTDPRQGAKFRL